MARIYNGRLQRALIVENPAIELDDLLKDQGFEVLRLTHIPKEDELIEIMKEQQTQVIFKRSKVKVTRTMIESCPSLLAVQLCCIGDDSVDKQACADYGIMVLNDPVSNGRSVVELVIGNLICLARRLYQTTIHCRDGGWDKNHFERYEVKGKHLGIVGLGNIGRAVARVADELGMNIHFYDTRQVSIELGKELGWEYHDSLDGLFATSDCVTIHVSARDIHGQSNEGMITQEHLMQLGANRPDGLRIFLNFGRGFIHHPEALIQAIDAGKIKQAAVDVYPHEPRGGDVWTNPYENCEQVAVFPHIGASTQEAQPRIARRVTQTLGAFSQIGAVRDSTFQPRANLKLSTTAKKGQALLMVCHSTARGTKRAIDEAIYEAGVSNLSSVHNDFDEYGFAYDLALIDHPLSDAQIQDLIQRAEQLTHVPGAIHSIRQVAIV